jgi:hypothetical protein
MPDPQNQGILSAQQLRKKSWGYSRIPKKIKKNKNKK